MTKSNVYRYLGSDGTVLETSVHLDGIYCVNLVRLVAGENKMLTNGKVTCTSIVVPEKDVDKWYEVANND